MVFGASSYLLEASSSPRFEETRTVYNGPDERYSPPPSKSLLQYESPFRTPNRIASRYSLGDFELDSGRTYLRVKAKGSPFLDDSPWSNVVET